MTKKRPPRGDRRPRSEVPADPAHAPGKQHLDLEAERREHLEHQVYPDTQSERSDSESRVGRGRMPRRG